jgi:hypothetical protein
MKQLFRVMGMLAVIGSAALALAWSEPEPPNDRTTQIECAYYGESCVPPAIFSRAYIRLFP